MAEQDLEHTDFTEDNNQEGDFQENGVNNGDGASDSQKQSAETSGSQDGDASNDPDRTLFVGGLSLETTEKDLSDYFTKYGPIKRIDVRTKGSNGRPLGFAFLVFNSTETIDKIVAVPEHTINGKKVDAKKAKPKECHGKILVTGLVPELSDDEIKNYFAKYGTIIEIDMPFDAQNNQRMGYCYITFTEKSVETDLLKTHKHTFNGHRFFVKKPTNKRQKMMMEGRGIWGQGGYKAKASGEGVGGRRARREANWVPGRRRKGPGGGKNHRGRPAGPQPY